MSKLIIKGKTVISGTTSITGSKNAVLPILAGTLLTDKLIHITNCPQITDVDNMLGILTTLGCLVERDGNALHINTRTASTYVMPEMLSKLVRSSIFMLGPVLARFRKASCVYPGGCEIGDRPIDLHLKGFRALNVSVTESDGHILCDGSDMRSGEVNLEYPSVGATENLMMAAVGLDGKTTIYNAAREPEIEDLQLFLRELGYNVAGAGTSKITIDGRVSTAVPNEIVHRVMPDRIVAGTLMCAAAITGGSLLMTDVVPEHVIPLMMKLREAGCTIEATTSSLRIDSPKRLSEIQAVSTQPHPGFPTDMQALMFAVCATADGTCVITENVFDNRFAHIQEFRKLGAVISQRDRTAVVRGVETLSGTEVKACDLRAGAALVLAGLTANGYTTVSDAQYIDRGYENLGEMLNSLGASIERFEE